MNLPSALIKKVLEVADFDTWMRVRKHYLPSEYHALYDVIEKYSATYHKLPTLSELKLSVRDGPTLDKVYALEGGEDIDAEPFLLLDYLKNEFAQKEALFQFERFIDRSLSFESAPEVVKSIQDIAVDIESKVDLKDESESMQKISLFDDEEEMGRRVSLGINETFDAQHQFNHTDYILIGGKRGAGKSLVCTNIANRVAADKEGVVLYFSIEMVTREVLQRSTSIATQIPFSKIRKKTMDTGEWEKLAKYWASRYENGDAYFKAYLEHRSFDTFHKQVSKELLVGPRVEIIFDPDLSTTRIQMEVDKRLALGENVVMVIVDYINQTRLKADSRGLYEWTEQIEVSKKLKAFALTYGIPFLSPYQIDATGEARFAKGILDSADAAFILEPHDDSMTFRCTKMRGADDEFEFTSRAVWDTVTIGPEVAEPPQPEEDEDGPKKGGFGKKKKKSSEAPAFNSESIYDDPPF